MRGLFLVLVLLFSPAAFADRVEFADSPLGDVIGFLAPKLERPVVIGADLSNKRISLYGSYESPQQLESLLQRAVESVGLHYVISDEVATISSVVMPGPSAKFSPPDLLKSGLDSPVSIVMPADTEPKTDLPMINHVYTLRHAQSSFALDVLLPHLTALRGDERPILMALPTSNSLVFSGTQAQFDLMNVLIPEIDRPRQQVLITAVVAELSDNDYRSLGANFKGAFGNLSAGSLTLANRSDLGIELTFSGPRLSAFVQAIQDSGNNRVLSTPQLLVLNREKASIVVGQNVPFLTGTTTSAATPADNPYQTITRQDVGLTLDVVPFITPNGEVELDIKQSASSVSNDRTASDVITNTRRLNTKIQLRDGDGVLLGGLRQQITEEAVSGIPLLRDIPGVGRLFEYRSTSKRSTNLVVLISARVFQSSTPTQANGVESSLRLKSALNLPD